MIPFCVEKHRIEFCFKAFFVKAQIFFIKNVVKTNVIFNLWHDIIDIPLKIFNVI